MAGRTPTECLLILSWPSTFRGNAEFSIELNDSGNRVMLCNIENPDFRYVTSSVDPSKFSPLFVTALSWLLASMLAGPILKGDVGAAEAKRCEQAALQYLTMARGQTHSP